MGPSINTAMERGMTGSRLAGEAVAAGSLCHLCVVDAEQRQTRFFLASKPLAGFHPSIALLHTALFFGGGKMPTG